MREITLEKIADWDNLYRAFQQARRGKRYRREVLRFSYQLEKNLSELRQQLLTEKYRHGRYRTFIVSDAKKRTINAAPFKDRVIHHAVCNIINDFFDPSFISDTYACRKGKGNRRAVQKAIDIVKGKQNLYCLQCDISKYFQSIDQSILLKTITKKIKDKKVIRLISIIIHSYYHEEVGQGIPIGNLTSQLMANLYLNILDQKMKRELKCCYIRYMDDFIIFYHQKGVLWQNLKVIQKVVKDIKLMLHPSKISIFPVKKGLTWLGYVVFPYYYTLKKNTVKRIIKRNFISWDSWLNYASKSCCYKIGLIIKKL
jgi:RNA-directed DNA polymerase